MTYTIDRKNFGESVLTILWPKIDFFLKSEKGLVAHINPWRNVSGLYGSHYNFSRIGPEDKLIFGAANRQTSNSFVFANG